MKNASWGIENRVRGPVISPYLVSVLSKALPHSPIRKTPNGQYLQDDHSEILIVRCSLLVGLFIKDNTIYEVVTFVIPTKQQNVPRQAEKDGQFATKPSNGF